MKKLTLIFASALLLLSLAAVTVQFAPEVFASPASDEICEGIGGSTNQQGCGDSQDLTNVVRMVVNIFSVVIGIVAVIMIMVAGFKYITAAGDTSNITSAKNTLIYAIIGIVIVAFSQLIVQFVLDTV